MKKYALLCGVLLMSGCGEKNATSTSEKPLTAAEIIEKSACLGCHHEGNTMNVPTWLDVARKYKASKEGAEFLASKIPHGGSGSWGKMEMPPYADLSREEVRVVVKEILATPIP
jgi:cytochrome c551/c552